mmetsp:Transcript_31009/g.40073  ORF Transcript_31009/g.40073 Transcript_31009/m.40073 type:complete len:114 (-) Transcript_31009:765-1106(-)
MTPTCHYSIAHDLYSASVVYELLPPNRKSNGFFELPAYPSKYGCLDILAKLGRSLGVMDKHFEIKSASVGSGTFSTSGSKVGSFLVICSADTPSKNPRPVLISYRNMPYDQTS